MPSKVRYRPGPKCGCIGPGKNIGFVSLKRDTLEGMMLNFKVIMPAISIALQKATLVCEKEVHISPSPWEKWRSPIENSAPSM
jgi:hypothetical protein